MLDLLGLYLAESEHLHFPFLALRTFVASLFDTSRTHLLNFFMHMQSTLLKRQELRSIGRQCLLPRRAPAGSCLTNTIGGHLRTFLVQTTS